jgi:N-methylhydantoinase A
MRFLIIGGKRMSGKNIIETRVFDRNRLPINSEITGPAIIEQLDSTIVIYPEQMAKIDSFGKIPAACGGGDNV